MRCAGQLAEARDELAAAAAQHLSCADWAADEPLQQRFWGLNAGSRRAHEIALALVKPSMRSYPHEQLSLAYQIEVCPCPASTIWGAAVADGLLT